MPPRSPLSAFPPDLVQKNALWTNFPDMFVVQCCRTFDEVDGAQAIKSIPKKRHVIEFCREWESYPLLCAVKSRRMLASWCCTGLELWECIVRPYTAVYVIGKTKKNSEEFLRRHEFMIEQLKLKEDFLAQPRIKVRKGVSGYPERIDFVDTGSRIEAVSSNPDEIRSVGATRIRCEELAFWEQPEKSWKAIMPAIQGGGKIVIVSTPLAGSFFEQIVKDKLPAAVGEME